VNLIIFAKNPVAALLNRLCVGSRTYTSNCEENLKLPLSTKKYSAGPTKTVALREMTL